MNDIFIYEFLTFFELWKSLDNMCFFEELFHRNQSLGARAVLNIGLWLNVFSRVKECTLLQCFAYGRVGICRVRYFDSVRDYLLSGIQLFRERLSEKKVHATIPKGNIGYDQYTVPDTVAVEPAFVAFL